jgi:hypothetical protein
MKTKLIILLAVINLVVSGCQDFLEQKPQGVLGTNALATRQGLDGLLTGAYALLDGKDSYFSYQWEGSNTNWVFGSMAGGDAHKGLQPATFVEIDQIVGYEALPGNYYFNAKWQLLYEAIARCNSTLKTLKITSDLTEDERVSYEAQAKALRGFFHFEAKRMWNMVPFIDENENPYEADNNSDIWPEIESDLSFAFDNLPVEGMEIGRFNKWAAGAFLAKVYLYQKKFTEAKPLLEDVYTNGTQPTGTKYKLNDKFQDNFSLATRNSPESVFAVQSSANDGSSGFNGNSDFTLNYPTQGNEFPYFGFSAFQPSQELVNSYRTDENGLPYIDGSYNDPDKVVKSDDGVESWDYFEPDAGNLDPRLDLTVGRRGVPFLDWNFGDGHPGKDWIADQEYGGPYSPKKMIFQQSEIYDGLVDYASYPTSSAINYSLIRFADVILWLAECEAEVGSLEKARAYVNEIRARAANPEGWVKAPYSTEPAALYVIAEYPAGAPFDTKENALRAIHFERKLELALEGHRFFDLVRWGEAEEQLNNYLTYEQTLRSFYAGKTFQPNDVYFPIPQTQIDLMGIDKLKQNNGY